MDIDDLKELKKWVSDVNALDDTRLIVCISLYDDVQYLLGVFECFIDEAIASQSATSEEVQEAIDMLQVIRPVWFVTENGNPFEGTDHDWGWRCSACDYEYPLEFDDPDRPPDYNYCPHCGQKIKE